MPVPAVLATDAFATERAESLASSLPPSAPFLLVWHGQQRGNVHVVNVDGRPRVLPLLMRCDIVPGACSVESPKAGEKPDRHYEAMMMRLQREGSTIIPRELQVPSELLPDGFPPGGYCRAIPAKNGGKAHIHPWMREARQFGRSSRLVEDTEAFHRFVAWLVDSGHLPAPSEEHLDDLRTRTKALYERARRDTKIPADLREERAGVFAATLAALDAAAKPSPSPAPKAKPTTRKAKAPEKPEPKAEEPEDEQPD